MIFDSMAACQAEGVSMCDAHPDLEVFRLRLGKALNFEFNEDTQTGLFQRRDPREGALHSRISVEEVTDYLPTGGPALDIERGNMDSYLVTQLLTPSSSHEQAREGGPSFCGEERSPLGLDHQQYSLLSK